MSIYSLGIAAMNSGVPVTPQLAYDEIRSVSNEVNSLGRDIVLHMREHKTPRTFIEGWRDFYKEAYDFHGNHKTWLARFNAASVMEKAVEIRKRGAAWREKFISIGGKPKTPAPIIGAELADSSESKGSKGINWTAIKWVGAGIVGLYIYKEYFKKPVQQGYIPIPVSPENPYVQYVQHNPQNQEVG